MANTYTRKVTVRHCNYCNAYRVMMGSPVCVNIAHCNHKSNSTFNRINGFYVLSGEVGREMDIPDTCPLIGLELSNE